MLGIVGIAAALTVLALSLLITRLATLALTLTGLSEESARFQARSAFTGTGFTTGEAEKVVNHPVRRRIIMFLMILRSAGLVTIVISLILTFGTTQGGRDGLTKLLAFLGGVAVLALLARSEMVDGYVSRVMRGALRRWTDLDARDYAALLKLSGGYRVMELRVNEGDWVAGKDLRACSLAGEGVNVLGVYRDDGSYVGAPSGDTEIYPGDVLLLYGRSRTLQELDKRRADRTGDTAHRRAVGEQDAEMERQRTREREHKHKRREKDGTRGDGETGGGGSGRQEGRGATAP